MNAHISARTSSRRVSVARGLTLVEVLVSIAIIGVLMALFLPSVQSVRESSRTTACSNNLKQLALGTHLFHNTHRRLPTNGWGFRWLGEPERGVEREQPGGWAFQLLPFIEQGQIIDSIGSGNQSDRADRLAEMAATAVPLFRCPSRPGDPTQPTANEINYFNAPDVGLTNRTDYAINEGDWVSNSGMGPPSDSLSDLRSYNWIDADSVTGVSWERGSTRLPEIDDGTAYTFLIGEKRVSFLGYGTSADNGHDQSMFSGVDLDTTRWTHLPPAADSIELDELERRFGAAHASGFHMSMCDTSIRFINYRIDAELYREQGTRR